jgi:DNA-binding GntR family transcriptional regulator
MSAMAGTNPDARTAHAAERAYIRIRKDLLTGRWSAGAHLGEKELAEELGVSRTPIREALRLLASDGLVSLEPNVGASVLRWTKQEIAETYDLRIELEGYAAGLAAANIPAEDIVLLKQMAEDMQAAAGKADFVRVGEINDRFHRSVIESSGNRRLTKIACTLLELTVEVYGFSKFNPEEMRRSLLHHHELVDALRRRDSKWATSVMRAHIHAGRAVILEERDPKK